MVFLALQRLTCAQGRQRCTESFARVPIERCAQCGCLRKDVTAANSSAFFALDRDNFCSWLQVRLHADTPSLYIKSGAVSESQISTAAECCNGVLKAEMARCGRRTRVGAAFSASSSGAEKAVPARALQTGLHKMLPFRLLCTWPSEAAVQRMLPFRLLPA